MSLTINFRRISFFSDLFRRNQNVLKGFSTISFSFKHLQSSILGENTEFSCHRNLCSKSLKFSEHPSFLKKRVVKKKKTSLDVDSFRITAFSTAEEYNLESLLETLPSLTDFKVTTFNQEYGSLTDVVHAVKSLHPETESQELFFFREGSVVMWNIQDNELEKIFDFLRLHEDKGFSEDVIQAESEVMSYMYSSDVNKTHIKEDTILFPDKAELQLEKYTVSNAMALSVHLGTYEATLEKYIEAMEPVTQDLKVGSRIKMSRDEVLQKTGQLFALRHNISLSSDLLDTPDFYWDRTELENLYQQIFSYFCISKRTRVINEKINHCIELVQLLSSHLNDKHHIRLEWMIIILIMVEVAFEVVHYLDRYLESETKLPNSVIYQS